MSVHCVIPAKGTSLGIAGKNLQTIAGQSLISITLRYSLSLPNCSNIVISTDSSAVLNETCQILQVESPSLDLIHEGSIHQLCDRYWIHRRMSRHASSDAKTIEFLPQILTQLGALQIDSLLLLQPTSPFRDIDEFNLLQSLYEGVDSVVSAKLFDSPHPAKKVRIDKKGNLVQEEHIVGNLSMPRQRLAEYYVLDGAFYLTNCSTVLAENTLIGKKTKLMIRSGVKTINIDNHDDLEIARSLVESGRVHLSESSKGLNC
jgi:CMP-N,N'-diacetyllegionaminic acid synthase